MPPRPDVFAREAEGIHRRYYSMVHALLMRHDLDGSGLGHSPGTEPLAPKLMLRLIGWSHQYQRRMARLGAGGDLALLCDDTTETVITAYIANTRSVSQQLSKNTLTLALFLTLTLTLTLTLNPNPTPSPKPYPYP